MLLRSIVDQLDLELTRLYTLRQIVAELEQTPPVLKELTPRTTPVPEPGPRIEKGSATRPLPRRSRAAAPKTPRTSKPPRPAKPQRKRSEPTPLKHEIPRGPVVVSADQLARERARRLSAPEQPHLPAKTQKPEPADIEGQSRALASRWISGSLAS